MFHRGQLSGHTPAILEEIPAMVCQGLPESAMLLDASKSQQMALFIASCGKALYLMSLLLGNYPVSCLIACR